MKSCLQFFSFFTNVFPSFSSSYRVRQHGPQVWGQREHGQRVEEGPVQERVPEVFRGQEHDKVDHKLGVQHQEPGHGGTHHTTAVLNEPHGAVPCAVAPVMWPNNHSGRQAPWLHICTWGQQRVVLLHVSQSVVWRLHHALEKKREHRWVWWRWQEGKEWWGWCGAATIKGKVCKIV